MVTHFSFSLYYSVIHDNNESAEGTSGSLDPMDIGSTHVEVPIDYMDIDVNNDEVSDANNGHGDPAVINIYLERMHLGRIMKEDVGSPEELVHAVQQFANLAGCYIFYYRSATGDYIRLDDYQSFNQFKNDLSIVEITAVGMGEIVNFP